MYLGRRNFVRVRGVFYNGKHREKDPSHFFGRVRGVWSLRGLPVYEYCKK